MTTPAPPPDPQWAAAPTPLPVPVEDVGTAPAEFDVPAALRMFAAARAIAADNLVTTAPTCGACGGDAVVNWTRRPTDDEVAEIVATEEERRRQLLLLADPQLPAPDFGPLPTGDGMTRTVYACATHAISLDAAALVHAKDCAAPAAACACTPEPPPHAPLDDSPGPQLPATWISG